LFGPNPISLSSVEMHKKAGKVGGYNKYDALRPQHPMYFLHKLTGLCHMFDDVSESYDVERVC
jgi:hypothetical protein